MHPGEPATPVREKCMEIGLIASGVRAPLRPNAFPVVPQKVGLRRGSCKSVSTNLERRRNYGNCEKISSECLSARARKQGTEKSLQTQKKRFTTHPDADHVQPIQTAPEQELDLLRLHLVRLFALLVEQRAREIPLAEARDNAHNILPRVLLPLREVDRSNNRRPR